MSAVLGESTASNRQGKMPTTSPFKPTSKPTSRKSLSALSGDLSNADMTKDSAKLDDVTGSAKIRKRAYSVGGVAAGAGGKNLSPRSQARRTAVSHRADKLPRKTLTVCSLRSLETKKIHSEDRQRTFRVFSQTTITSIITHANTASSSGLSTTTTSPRTHDKLCWIFHCRARRRHDIRRRGSRHQVWKQHAPTSSRHDNARHTPISRRTRSSSNERQHHLGT
jgi:hypothetical protein